MGARRARDDAQGGPEAGRLAAQLLALSVSVAALAWAVYRFRIAPRRGSFEAQARQAGLEAQAGDPLGVISTPFALFGRAASARDLENTAWGARNGREIAVADYWYAPSSNPSLDDYRRFVCVIDSARPEWPDLSVVPADLASIAMDAVGVPRVDLGSERFDRSFSVQTADRRFANAFLDARMMEWLMLQAPGMGFEIVAGRLMVFEPRHVLSLDDVDRALRRFDGLLEHVPPVVSSLFPATRPTVSPG
ncbi:MAG: hypothetical protein M3Q20_00485 [Actinomycetota bacterium]|nr:hypothetical protein [Actinomycetota bacterium]